MTRLYSFKSKVIKIKLYENKILFILIYFLGSLFLYSGLHKTGFVEVNPSDH